MAQKISFIPTKKVRYQLNVTNAEHPGSESLDDGEGFPSASLEARFGPEDREFCYILGAA